MTSYRIEPATFQFVAQHRKHCATAVPQYLEAELSIQSEQRWLKQL
jgi:hypothetical protein